jgi:D-alanyl-D-alanine carboxypeptidase
MHSDVTFIIEQILMQILIFILSLFTSSIGFAFTSNIQPLAEEHQQTLQDRIASQQCPVPAERLVEVTFSYYDFNNTVRQDGSIIVLDAAANHVQAIFNTLYQQRFPIEAAIGFECRLITGNRSNMSLHAYGLALDINPTQNPYIAADNTSVGKAKVIPAAGIRFINRTNQRPGMLEPVVHIFQSKGFTIWGGTWNDPVDWHHFQTPKTVADLLTIMTKEDGEIFFDSFSRNPTLLTNWCSSNKNCVARYQSVPTAFMQRLMNQVAQSED